MRSVRAITGLAFCASTLLFATEVHAESVAWICMWPDGRPTKVVVNDASTVTWSTNNTAPAKITNDLISWEIPGQSSFALNRRSSRIRITGVAGLRNVSKDYACSTTAP